MKLKQVVGSSARGEVKHQAQVCALLLDSGKERSCYKVCPAIMGRFALVSVDSCCMSSGLLLKRQNRQLT